MNFETFRGRDVKEALGLVRAAYGNDAIIASTRVVNNGRNGALAHSFVEVKAAPSDSPAPMPLPHKAFPFARANAQKLEAQRDATLGCGARLGAAVSSSAAARAFFGDRESRERPRNAEERLRCVPKNGGRAFSRGT